MRIRVAFLRARFWLRAFVLGVLAVSTAIACGGVSPSKEKGPAKEQAAIAVGGSHTCALTRAGGVKCWGGNWYGQVGDGTITNRNRPVAVSGLTSGVVTIAAGYIGSCALTSAGGVKCWGFNEGGQVGDGTMTNRNRPVAVSGLTSGVAAVAVGYQHTCALTRAGKVKCWGYNPNGELGDGTTTGRRRPVAVSGLDGEVTAIAVGQEHSCALTSAGAVRCWGRNDDGELGDGTTTQRNTPVAVSGLASGVAAIALGGVQSCALTTAGEVKCWGNNDAGQLGDGTTTARHRPVVVSGLATGVRAIAPGLWHTCALTSAGAVKCWGGNGSSGLGDGTTSERHKPVTVSGLASGVTAIAAGGGHTCALTSAGALKCWGANDYGGLGDGTTVARRKPVGVIGFGESSRRG